MASAIKNTENFWEKEEWQQILAAFNDWQQKPKEKDAELIFLATTVTLYTGSRIGEVIGMRKTLIKKYTDTNRQNRIINGLTPANINFNRAYITFQLEKKNPIKVFGRKRKGKEITRRSFKKNK